MDKAKITDTQKNAIIFSISVISRADDAVGRNNGSQERIRTTAVPGNFDSLRKRRWI
jgi:hypothetical protein